MRNAIIALLAVTSVASADRIKDLAQVEGIRDNHITGFGPQCRARRHRRRHHVADRQDRDDQDAQAARSTPIDPDDAEGEERGGMVMVTADLPAFGQPGQLDRRDGVVGGQRDEPRRAARCSRRRLKWPRRAHVGDRAGCASRIGGFTRRAARERLDDEEEPHARRRDPERRDGWKVRHRRSCPTREPRARARHRPTSRPRRVVEAAINAALPDAAHARDSGRRSSSRSRPISAAKVPELIAKLPRRSRSTPTSRRRSIVDEEDRHDRRRRGGPAAPRGNHVWLA